MAKKLTLKYILKNSDSPERMTSFMKILHSIEIHSPEIHPEFTNIIEKHYNSQEIAYNFNLYKSNLRY